MKKSIFRFLRSYTTEPFKVDRIIISAFVRINNINIGENILLNRYLISENHRNEYKNLFEFVCIINNELTQFEFEDLIELFEFVVSPSDRVINGAVYTPSYIRNYIVDKTLSSSANLNNIKICDPACGCAGFLYSIAKELKERTGRTFIDIFSDSIYGLDIQSYSTTRAELLLTLVAVKEGEVLEEVPLNIYQGNALSFDWANCITNYSGFDVIVGNPPYVCSRNMDEESLDLLSNWTVSTTGHPDLYIPFFQIGYDNLALNGQLGFITVNTFIKSINGRALRKFFAEKKISLKIINFGGEQVFKKKNTYTCICFIQKKEGTLKYSIGDSHRLTDIDNQSFLEYQYNSLNHHDGWNLLNSKETDEFIRKIESIGRPFQELYTTRNGIATLKNDVYKFIPIKEDKTYYYVEKSNKVHAIEKSICRKIINANKIKSNLDLSSKLEQIIFPYLDGSLEIIPEDNFKINYPNAYKYLKSQKALLDTRDKGNVSDYECWYAYGRRQSMDINAYKLFFPHICERPRFVISKDKDLLFYNGIAVISEKLEELEILKTLLETDVFFEYIRNTSKNYTSGYISMSRNYLKNFGVPTLTQKQIEKILSSNVNHNLFWRKIYEIEMGGNL